MIKMKKKYIINIGKYNKNKKKIYKKYIKNI